MSKLNSFLALVVFTILAVPVCAQTETQQEQAGNENEKIDLPWETEKKNIGLPVLDELTIRDLIDIDDGELEHLYDYEPIEPDNQMLIKVLFRLETFSDNHLIRFSKQSAQITSKELTQAATKHRLEIVRVQGRVSKIERHHLLPEIGELYPIPSDDGKDVQNLDSYYKVFATIAPDNHPVMVCCRKIPIQWRKNLGLIQNETFEANAMFLKVNGLEDSLKPELLFATKRIEWFPNEQSKYNLNKGLITLVSKGFDAGRIEDIMRRSGKEIGQNEGTAFYQFIAAAKELTPSDQPTPEPFDLETVVGSQNRPYGQYFKLEADVRRVTPVKVTQSFYRDALGVKNYYQLDAFIKIDKTINQKFKEERVATYKNRFPITLCVTELPDGLSENSTGVTTVSFEGFFYKNWSYRSDWIEKIDPSAKQIAPLMIGRSAKVLRSQTELSNVPVILIGIIGFVFVGILWFGLKQTARIGKTPEFKIESMSQFDDSSLNSRASNQAASKEQSEENQSNDLAGREFPRIKL